MPRGPDWGRDGASRPIAAYLKWDNPPARRPVPALPRDGTGAAAGGAALASSGAGGAGDLMTAFRAVRLAQLVTPARPGLTLRNIPAEPYTPVHPLRIGAKMLPLFGLSDEWRPAQHDSIVYTIEDAFVLSSAGIIGLPTGELAEDTLDHTDPALDGYERRGGHTLLGVDGLARPEGGWIHVGAKPAELAGRHLSLLLGVHTNHFHWLLMNFARIALLDRADLQLDSILVPAGLTPLHLEAIRHVEPLQGIPLRPVRRGESLRVRSLVLPWNIASGSGVNPAAVAFLRDLIPSKAVSGTRRIYIDRRQSPVRRLINEDELINGLHKMDIEPVRLEGLSLRAQANLLREANLVVAPHGAGLANIVWAASGTRVIELVPSGVTNWCYRHLAAASGHVYDCVLGRSHPREEIPAFAADWTVSPTHVLSALSDHGGDFV